MCGIIGIIRLDKKAAARNVRKRYHAQKGRGTDGFGYIAIEHGKIVHVERAQYEKEILESLAREQASTVVFHHRTPTSIENVAEAAHPILVSNKELSHNYYVVHNGIISNTTELKAKHEKLGYQYTTQGRYQLIIQGKPYDTGTAWNDSESFAIELARRLDGKTSTIKAEGSIAFIAVAENKQTGFCTIQFGRNYSSPLRYHHSHENIISIASEGAGDEATAHTLYTVHADGTITLKEMDFCDYHTLYNGTRRGYLGTSGAGEYDGYKGGYSMDDDEEGWMAWKQGGKGLGEQLTLPPPKTDPFNERLDDWEHMTDLEREKREAEEALVRAIEAGDHAEEANLNMDLECIEAELLALRQDLEIKTIYGNAK